MPFRAPVAEMRFLLDHVAGYGAVTATERFAAAGGETMDLVLAGAGRLAERLAPLNRTGDLHPARIEDGVVRTPPGFAGGYAAIRDGGWVGMAAAPEWGGLGLPMALTTAVNDMLAGGCLALQLATLLTQGQIEAIDRHADEKLKSIYLPRLASGEWSGIMNLTEAQAGSDVGALRTRAEPRSDGSYAITGQKIFITWADADFLPNVCHMVLARLPDGEPGTAGISLFLVPKFLPDAAGNPGQPNRLKVVSLEHKLGLHGSPTAVMQYEGATGWLVGAPHGGIKAMFTMMNNARLGVGAQAIGTAEAACQLALAYAMQRMQGRAPLGDGSGTIIDHPDVRRMLAVMRAEIRAARGIALQNAVAIDMAAATGDSGWRARAALLTPICKSFGTETGIKVADLGIQVHGGTGYVEETGAAQFSRDVRVTAIYEGTNGIQAMDLVGRKMADGGAEALRLIGEIEEAARGALETLPDLAQPVLAAASDLDRAVRRMAAAGIPDRLAGAIAFQRAFARVLGGHVHLAAARAGGSAGPHARLARVYVARLLPETAGLLAEAAAGAADLSVLTAADLGA